MGRILRPYNPLIYPGGRNLGFDPSHMAVSANGVNVSVVAQSGTFISVRTSAALTNTGSGGILWTINGALGPCAVTSVQSGDIAGIALPSGDCTQAFIGFPTSNPGFCGLISSAAGVTAALLCFNGTFGNYYGWGGGLSQRISFGR